MFTCIKCEEPKELNASNFSMLGYSRVGQRPYYRKTCKACMKADYRAAHPERSTPGPKSYFQQNPEQKAQVIDMLSGGTKMTQIASELGIPVHVLYVAKKKGLFNSE